MTTVGTIVVGLFVSAQFGVGVVVVAIVVKVTFTKSVIIISTTIVGVPISIIIIWIVRIGRVRWSVRTVGRLLQAIKAQQYLGQKARGLKVGPIFGLVTSKFQHAVPV